MIETQQEGDRMRFSFGYISAGLVHLLFVAGLTDLLQSRFAGDLERVIAYQSGPDIASGRTAVVDLFLADKRSDVLVFCDIDMAFTAEHVGALLNHMSGSGVGIVGASYTAMVPVTGESCAESGQLDVSGVLRPYRPSGPGPITAVAAVGAGLVAIRRDVFVDVAARNPRPLPWFQFTVRHGETVGEDYEFCLRAREAGHRVAVALDVRVPHVKAVAIRPPGGRLSSVQSSH